jgi:cell shape-determining protein MreC
MWVLIQFLFIMILIWLFVTQVIYSVYMGYPYFWLFRPKTFADHLKKAKEELKKEEELYNQDLEEANELAKQAKKRKDNLRKFQTSLKKGSK